MRPAANPNRTGTQPVRLISIAVLLAGAGFVWWILQPPPETMEEHAVFQPSSIEGYDSLLWKSESTADEPVVANVEGTPITLTLLKTQLDRLKPELDELRASWLLEPMEALQERARSLNVPQFSELEKDALIERILERKVLQQLIEFELLARQAFESGKYESQTVRTTIQKALASVWVERHFERGLTPADIPAETMELAYRQAIGIFDHFTRFFIADLQIICCREGNADACYQEQFDDVDGRREFVESCYEYHRPIIEAVRSRISETRSLEDLREVKAMLEVDHPPISLRDQYRTHLGMQEYNFEYDVNRTYEEQFEQDTVRYRDFGKEIMDGVKEAYLALEASGEMAFNEDGHVADRLLPIVAGPFRSVFGWHVLFVYEMHPEKHWPLSHPDVQRQVREHSFTKWRAMHFKQEMERLCKETGCELQHHRLVPLQESEEQALAQ